MKNRLTNIKNTSVDDVYEIGSAIFNRQSNLQRLKELMIPFAIITGEDDSARVPRESEEMAKVANNDRLFYIKNAGHISCLEQPNEVNEVLIQFLRNDAKSTRTL